MTRAPEARVLNFDRDIASRRYAAVNRIATTRSSDRHDKAMRLLNQATRNGRY